MTDVKTKEKTKQKKRGLGRGLDALFEDDEGLAPGPANVDAIAQVSDVPSDQSQKTLGIDQLQQGAFQPRTLFDDESLNELAESIKSHGVLQPILVRPIADKAGKYEIIAGERRWRAAQRAKLHDVPVIIMELTDGEAFEIALIENLQRENLNPVDEAMGYQKLMEEFDHTQEALAELLGKSRPYISNMIRLLELPDVVLALLERGDLSVGHARALITAKNPESLAKKIVAQDLSVRETEKLVAQSEGRKQKSKTKSKPGKDTDTLALEKDLSNSLGMNVTIDSRDGKQGRIFISFKSLDQLDEILKRLSN